MYIFLTIISIILILIILLFIDYKIFINKRIKTFNNINKINTTYGDVSYVDINPEKENVILFCTGGGVGIDSVYSFKWLSNLDYRIICINRPGYNGLPLANSFDTHVEIYNEVLTKLNIHEVTVFGVSMGGIAALKYTEKYKVNKLLLYSAITTNYTPNEDSTNSFLGKLVMKSNLKDVISYLIYKSVKLMPITTATEFFVASAKINKKELKKEAKVLLKNKENKKDFINFAESMTPMSAIYEGMMREVELSNNVNIDFNKINIPTLAIHSVLDKDVPITHLDHLESNLTNIKTLRVNCIGHYIWWGQGYKEVLEKSKNFLNNK